LPLVGFNRSNNIGFLAQGDVADTHEGKGLILVIDDEVTILRGLKMVLESWGYAVITATSEAAAIILLEEQPYGPGDTDPDRLQEAESSGYRLLHKPVAPPLLRSVLESYRTV
jgi:two-component system, sensor histidine kinase